MEATWAISLRSDTSIARLSSTSETAATAASMPRFSDIGLAPAATFQALADHRLGEHGRGGGAVTGYVVGLGGHLLGELGAHVLVGVVQLDLAGDGHAIVRDGRCAELLVEDDVATLGPQRHLDCVGERVHSALQRLTGVRVERQHFGHVCLLPLTRVRPGGESRSRGGSAARFQRKETLRRLTCRAPRARRGRRG